MNPESKAKYPTWKFRLAPPKFWSIGYRLPGGPVVYIIDGGVGGSGQQWVGGFFSVGGGDNAGGGGGGGRGGGLCVQYGVHLTP